MFNRFFSNNLKSYLTPQNLVRGYNLLTAGAVLASYFLAEDPDSQEYFTDIGIHLLQAGMREDSPEWYKMALLAVNLYRIYDINYRMVEGKTSIETLANEIDFTNHYTNGAATAASLFGGKPQEKNAVDENEDEYRHRKVM